MKTAGLVLDFYDDRTGETLKSVYPSAEELPETVKEAHILSPEERAVLRDEAYALILHSDDGQLRKFACVDEGNTALSTLYFLVNAEKLPAEAIKTAAQNLIAFNEEFGMEVPFELKLAAETGMPTVEKTASMARKRDSFRQPMVGEEADWAQRTNLLGVRGGSDAGRVIPTANQMKTAGVALKKLRAAGEIAWAKGGRGVWDKMNYLNTRGRAKTYGAMAAKDIASGKSGTLPIKAGQKMKEWSKTDMAPLRDKTAMLGSPGIGIPTRVPRPMPTVKKLTGPALAAATSKAEADFWKRGPKAAVAPAVKAKAAHVDNLIDVSSLNPKMVVKQKVASLTALDGRYSLDSYSDVQQAMQFFEENWVSMDPSDRHEFAVKTSSRADNLGIATSELMDRYGSTEYGPDVEAHLANRAAVDPDHRIIWDDLKEKQAMIEPEQFASLLREADELFGLDAYWGGEVMDPYYATFGGRGQEKVAWAHQTADGATIDEAALRAIPKEEVEKNFAPDFAEAFSQNPTLIFDSMPADSKQVLARMARDA